MFSSKKVSLIILGITSVLLSRAIFFFIDDPEGPNLLVVFAMAAIVFVPSLIAYIYSAMNPGLRKLALVIVVQIIFVTCLYVLLR